MNFLFIRIAILALAAMTRSGTVTRPQPLFRHFPNYTGGGHPDATGPCSVVRDGDWKLIEHLEDGRKELYNLRTDSLETTDLASLEPELATGLTARLHQWWKDTDVQMPRPNPDHNAGTGLQKGMTGE